MAKKPPAYSHSALEIFHGGDIHGGCPLAYKLIRIDRIARAASEPLIIGRMLHELAAKYLNRLISHGLQTDWDFAQGITPKEAPADVLEVWPRFVENFILPPMGDPGVEKQLAFTRKWEPCGWFDSAAYFRMVVDWTFTQGGLVVIVDWKSNRSIMNEVEKNLQLRTYGWGVRRALYPDAQEILLRLHFLRYGAEREIMLAPEDLDTVPAELDAKIAEIEAEKHFDPRPGSYCSWCGVQSHCPTMAQALVPVSIIYPASKADAVKAGSILLAIREMEKAITAHLKAYVQEFGPIQVGDMIYGPVPGTDYDLDPRTVAEGLLERGYDREDIWKVLSVGKTSLDRGLKDMGLIGKRSKERKALVEEFLAGAVETPTETFKFHKGKEG
jgi:hypothetical protein